MRVMKGDTFPIEYQILVEAGGGKKLPLNLTNATSVKFRMRPDGSATYSVDKAATIDSDRESGIVRYTWAAGETALAGMYIAQWEITWKDGTIKSYPSDQYLWIWIIGE